MSSSLLAVNTMCSSRCLHVVSWHSLACLGLNLMLNQTFSLQDEFWYWQKPEILFCLMWCITCADYCEYMKLDIRQMFNMMNQHSAMGALVWVWHMTAMSVRSVSISLFILCWVWWVQGRVLLVWLGTSVVNMTAKRQLQMWTAGVEVKSHLVQSWERWVLRRANSQASFPLPHWRV